ncbi:MAG: AraC family transcriptional regulator [Bacteroidota bacterium]
MDTSQASIHREITPLIQGDCLLVFDRTKNNFDFPVHFHPEYELNLILNAPGAKRIVGDHMDYIKDYELVFIGPNLFHGWEQGKCNSLSVHEITIQFHKDLFNTNLLNRNIMKPVKELLQRSLKGVLFSKEETKTLLPRILKLYQNNGFDSFIELLSLLHDLSNTGNQQLLSTNHSKADDFYNSDKIKKAYEFIQLNFRDKIKLEDIAGKLNMTTISFSRLIKRRTGKTFVEFLNDYRIGAATRMLIDSNDSVAEIAFKCGFNNLANFNRIFKKSKDCSPTQFKNNFLGIKRFY